MAKKLDDLKKLPPEERIRRLKEIEEEDKKEIEEAKKLMTETEDEAEEEEKSLRSIPIPQMRAIDIGSLFSPEEKQMFSEKRPLDALKRKDDDDDKKPKKRAASDLEDALDSGVPNLSREQLDFQKQYIQQLATERPATDIYQGLTSLAKDAHEKGYLNQEQQGQLYMLYNAAVEKNRAFHEGEYHANQTIAENIADALDLFREIKKKYIQ